jgi:hypothetical protein
MTEREVAAEKVSIDDIRSKLREIGDEVDQGVSSARQGRTALIVAGGVVVIIFAFWLGWSRGRRQQTVLEIRRI